MQIQISWLLQKPTDLDLHCLQNRVYPGSAGQGLKSNKAVLFHLSYRKSIMLRLNSSAMICFGHSLNNHKKCFDAIMMMIKYLMMIKYMYIKMMNELQNFTFLFL